MKTCLKAPKGWKCTREAGHEGPCAAVKVSWYSKVLSDVGNLLGETLFGGNRCILALLLLPAMMFGQTASNQYKTIKTNWIPPVIGGTVYPACNFAANPPINTACVNGYEEVLTAPGGSTNSILPCTATLVSSCIPWGVSTYSWSPGGFLFVGTWGISLTVAYYDPFGVQMFTAPVIGSVIVPNPTNPPSPATGVNASLAP